MASSDSTISCGSIFRTTGISKKFPNYIRPSATKSVSGLESKILCEFLRRIFVPPQRSMPMGRTRKIFDLLKPNSQNSSNLFYSFYKSFNLFNFPWNNNQETFSKIVINHFYICFLHNKSSSRNSI